MMKILHKLLQKFQPKPYLSEIGQSLARFDQQHPEKSNSQRQEINKFKRIFALRSGNPKHS